MLKRQATRLLLAFPLVLLLIPSTSDAQTHGQYLCGYNKGPGWVGDVVFTFPDSSTVTVYVACGIPFVNGGGGMNGPCRATLAQGGMYSDNHTGKESQAFTWSGSYSNCQDIYCPDPARVNNLSVCQNANHPVKLIYAGGGGIGYTPEPITNNDGSYPAVLFRLVADGWIVVVGGYPLHPDASLSSAITSRSQSGMSLTIGGGNCGFPTNATTAFIGIFADSSTPEEVKITAMTTTLSNTCPVTATVTNMERGFNGTTATTHANNVRMWLCDVNYNCLWEYSQLDPRTGRLNSALQPPHAEMSRANCQLRYFHHYRIGDGMHYSLVGGSQGSSVVFEAEELISNRWPDYPSSCEWSDAPVKPTFLAINSAVTNLDIPSRPYVDGSGETNDQYASYMDGGPGYDPTGGVKGNEGNIAEMWATGLSTTGTGCGFNLGINDCGATATCHISFDAFGRWRPLGATAELTMVQDNTALSCLSNGPGTCFNIPNQTNTAGYVITGDCDQVTMPGTQQQFVARHGNLMQRVFAGAPHGVTRRCAGDNGWDECAASPAGSVYFADPVIHDGKYDPVPK